MNKLSRNINQISKIKKKTNHKNIKINSKT